VPVKLDFTDLYGAFSPSVALPCSPTMLTRIANPSADIMTFVSAPFHSDRSSCHRAHALCFVVSQFRGDGAALDGEELMARAIAENGRDWALKFWRREDMLRFASCSLILECVFTADGLAVLFFLDCLRLETVPRSVLLSSFASLKLY
jgi:hypothetical protein